MRPPRYILVFAANELDRSEWRYAIDHHSPSRVGVFYDAEGTGDVEMLARTVAIFPPRAILLVVESIANAAHILARLPASPPVVIFTRNPQPEWPQRPAYVACVTPRRDVAFAALDQVSAAKRGPKRKQPAGVAQLTPA